MRTFTLDTNCLIDVEEGRPAAVAIRALADAHAEGLADVAVVAMSASERQKNGHRIGNFSEFESRLAEINLAHLSTILPMAHWDICFWDRCLWADQAMVDLESQIHSILFPNIEFSWDDYCRDKGIGPSSNSLREKWRNRKCDVQAMWSHIHAKRAVFVTNDGNFHAATKKPPLIVLGANRIERPDDAVLLI